MSLLLSQFVAIKLSVCSFVRSTNPLLVQQRVRITHTRRREPALRKPREGAEGSSHPNTQARADHEKPLGMRRSASVHVLATRGRDQLLADREVNPVSNTRHLDFVSFFAVGFICSSKTVDA